MTHKEINDNELDIVTGGNGMPQAAERMICQSCGQSNGDFKRVEHDPPQPGVPKRAFCESCGAEYDFSLGNYLITWAQILGK